MQEDANKRPPNGWVTGTNEEFCCNFMRLRTNNRLAAAALFLAAVWTGGSVQASIIPVYSNFGYLPSSGYDLSGNQVFLATSFSPSQAATLDYALVALFPTRPPDPEVNVFVYSDSAGLPGALLSDLGSITVPPPVDPLNPPPASVYQSTSSPAPGLTLLPGSSYWLVLKYTIPGISWAMNANGMVDYATSADGSNWSVQTPDPNPPPFAYSPAFEIYGTPIPEPSTCIAGALLAIPFGLQGIRCLRDCKRVP